MRRTLVYLSVALLAFGIGSFVVFEFWSQSFTTKKTEIAIETKSIEQTSIANTPKTAFTCEDEVVKTVWEKLDKNKDYLEWKNSVIESNDFKNCQEFFERKTIDLNNDKLDEIVLKGERPMFCGSGGDCQTWIVSKINNEYKVILEAKIGENPGDIQFLQETTHNFQNIKIKINHGWASDNFGFFKFDGKRYRVRKCFEDVNSNYDYDDIYEEKLISVKLSECL